MSELSRLFVRECPCKEEYKQRLEYELNIIDTQNFTRIFIIVANLIQKVHCLYICRGSAASSLVCYLLGITHIDPLEHSMNFSRFLNPKRISQPDIDIDFPHHLHKQIFDILYSCYPSQVGRVINHVFYKSKSAWNKALKLTKGTVNAKTFKISSSLLNQPNYDSIHCGGAVVFSGPVPKPYIHPKQFLRSEKIKDSSKSLKLKLDKREVENEGLVKIDLLSNRGLSILQALDNKRQISDYPALDPKITDLLNNLDVLGVTFIETPNMIRVIRIIKPDSPILLSLCLALARPAPNILNLVNAKGSSRETNSLQRGSNGTRTQKERILVYDDDMIEQIADWLEIDFSTAESIRKGLTKNAPGAWDAFKLRLLSRYEVKKVNQIIEDCQFVRKYSFCKSHSLNYAYLCWALLWHKAHNRTEFWRAVLNHSQSMYEDWVYFRTIIHEGYSIELTTKKERNAKTWRTKNNYFYLTDTPKKQSSLDGWVKKDENREGIIDTDILKVQQLRTFGYWTGSWISHCRFEPGWCCGIVATYSTRKFLRNVVTFYSVMVEPDNMITIICSEGEVQSKNKNIYLIEADITFVQDQVYNSSRYSFL